MLSLHGRFTPKASSRAFSEDSRDTLCRCEVDQEVFSMEVHPKGFLHHRKASQGQSGSNFLILTLEAVHTLLCANV